MFGKLFAGNSISAGVQVTKDLATTFDNLTRNPLRQIVAFSKEVSAASHPVEWRSHPLNCTSFPLVDDFDEGEYCIEVDTETGNQQIVDPGNASSAVPVPFTAVA